MMAKLEPRFHGGAEGGAPGASGAAQAAEVVDMGARMRSMW